MAKKIYIDNNYLIVEDSTSGRLDLSEPKAEVRAFVQDGDVKIKLKSDRSFYKEYKFSELIDSGDSPFANEAALNTFFRENTGFSTALGGSSALDWNASTNTPTLANTDVNLGGLEYKVIVAGTVNFGADDITFNVGDIAANDGSIWYKKVDNNQLGSLQGNNTISFTIEGVNSRIITPVDYDDKGEASHCVMFIHGNNGDETDAGSTNFKDFCRDNNIAIITTNGQDEIAAPFTTNASGWGNEVQSQRYIALYKYCQSNYNLSSNVILVCGSMGGLVAGQFMYYKPFPIIACFMAGPVPDLSYIFANGGTSRQEPIRNAYGMASDGSDDVNLEDFIQGYDWYDMGLVDVAGTNYKFGFPKIYIEVGTGDGTFTTDFGGTVKYTEIVDAIESAGGYIHYNEIPSVSHAADECYDNFISKEFFEKELGINNGGDGLGVELFTNPTFNGNLSGWTDFDGKLTWQPTYDGSVVIDDQGRIGQAVMTIGVDYRLVVNIEEATSAKWRYLDGAVYTEVDPLVTGEITIDFTAAGTSFILQALNAGLSMTVSSMSLKEIL